MNTTKERIYLTDITLHVRKCRQTVNFSKVAQKGRMYSPLPKNYAEKFEPSAEDFSMSVTLPKDLMEKIHSGEVELMMPKDGLYIFPGKDTVEAVKKKERKERTQLIHRSRAWHADK